MKFVEICATTQSATCFDVPIASHAIYSFIVSYYVLPRCFSLLYHIYRPSSVVVVTLASVTEWERERDENELRCDEFGLKIFTVHVIDFLLLLITHYVIVFDCWLYLSQTHTHRHTISSLSPPLADSLSHSFPFSECGRVTMWVNSDSIKPSTKRTRCERVCLRLTFVYASTDRSNTEYTTRQNTIGSTSTSLTGTPSM